MPAMSETQRIKGAGGTRGGIGQFFLGCAMAVSGGYLLTNQIIVRTSFWQLWGRNTFGLTFDPVHHRRGVPVRERELQAGLGADGRFAGRHHQRCAGQSLLRPHESVEHATDPRLAGRRGRPGDTFAAGAVAA